MWIFHQRRAFSIVYHLRNRTAHIKIDNVIRAISNFRCHFTDNFRIRAKQLHGNRSLLWFNLQKFFCISIMIENRFSADHFGIQEPASLLPAYFSKRGIGHSCHWRQYQIILQFYISYAQLHLEYSFIKNHVW